MAKSAGAAGVCIGNGVASGAATGAGVGAATSAFFGGTRQQQTDAAGRGAAMGALWGALNGAFSYAYGHTLITLGTRTVQNTGIAIYGALEAGSEFVFPFFTTVDTCLTIRTPSCPTEMA